LLNRFDSIDIQHIPRTENYEANDLAQIASGYKASKSKLQDLIEVKNKLVLNSNPQELSMQKLGGEERIFVENFAENFENFSENLEIFVIDNLPNNDWRKPIVEYLENPTGTTDRKISCLKRHLRMFY
jgi:hypothetical protein